MKKLISKSTLQRRVRELARQISFDYQDRRPVLVGILKGSFMFLADLARAMTIPVEIDFLWVTSYQDRHSSGIVRLNSDLSQSIKDRDVIVVEDIVDSGRTMKYIIKNLKNRRPRSLQVCCLLDKKTDRPPLRTFSYVGFSIPPGFAVGYGLDYRDQYRHLPYIGVIDAE